MRCLVTGVAGFIGSHLAERLLVDGHEVVGIDSFTDYYPRFMKERNIENIRSDNHFTFFEADIRKARLEPLLDGMDYVFHLAAQAGVRASWGHSFEAYTDCNILATQCLLEAILALNQSIKRFVYASTSSVYGNSNTLPITESNPLHPISPYGVTKLAGEHLCQSYEGIFGIPTTILRYFTVYGPRQRPDMAFHRFSKALIECEPIHIFDDGRQTRDFTYVDDVVEATIHAAMSEAQGSTMNIAGGSRVNIHDVIEILEEISGNSSQIIFEKKQPGDVRDTFADTNKARSLIDFKVHTPLRTGLAREFEAVVHLYKDRQRSIAL